MTKPPASVMSKAFWSQSGGVAWAGQQPLMDRLYQGVLDAIVAAAELRPGENVLDIGCGGGSLTRAAAQRVGPAGRSVGFDISPDLLETARQSPGDESAAFQLGDAQTHPFEAAAFDAVVSRFGVMFFDDPVAAFVNLRRALKRDGRLVFACWRAAAENPLVNVPMQVAAPLLSRDPPAPPPPGAPGRFAFADPKHVRGVLEASGWRSIDIAPLDSPSPLSIDELIAITLRGESPADQERVRGAVTARLEADAVDGVIPMVSACWLVRAEP